MCVYCNRSQIASQRVKKKEVRDEVEWRDVFFTRFEDLLQYTHTERCNLFVIKFKDLGGIKKEKHVCRRGFDVVCVCVL